MAIFTVGLTGQFATISAAVAAAHNGDTINVTADHTYSNDFLLIQKSLTLQAVGGEVKMVATVQPGNGKAMIVEGAPGLSIAINGFDISGVKVPDQNGAAIRYQGGNLSLSNVYFHNNQQGLLGAPDPLGTITVDHSEFGFNGGDGGFAHNLYASGALAKLTVTNSYFHDAIQGHEIKSFAAENVITGNRIFDNAGTSSYSIDLPRGGNATISGNVIEQGAHGQNFYIFAYGEGGATNPGTSVSIDHNTIVNDRANGHNILNGSTMPIAFTDNSVWSATPAPPLPSSGPVDDEGTISLAGRPVLDLSPMRFLGGVSGGGTASPPPAVDPPPVSPPPPPPPMQTVADYHAAAWSDFLAWAPSHPAQLAQPATLAAFFTEVNSTTVLGVIPGDLWSPHPA